MPEGISGTPRKFGSDIVKEGVMGAAEHCIQAIQVEKVCDRKTAVAETVRFLRSLATAIETEEGNP